VIDIHCIVKILENMEFVIPISNIDDMNAVNLNICNVQSSWVGHMQSNVNFA